MAEQRRFPAEPFPSVTVIMPVYNESTMIRQALGAVLAQDYPADRLDVLVVDGRSTDDTVAHVKAFRDARVRVLDNPQRRQAEGLNRGIAAARGSVIVRVDGHTVIAPDYVAHCVEMLRTTGADNVGGPQRMIGRTPTGQAIAAAYRSPFSVPSAFTVSDREGEVDTVYLGAWPREVLIQHGGFDPRAVPNEDYDLNFRIRQAGGKVYLAPDIRSEYYGRETLGALARQFFRYGQGKVAVLTRHPRSVRARHIVAPAFVAVLIGGVLLAPLSRRIACLWRATIGAYAVAAGIASAACVARSGWRLLPRLPLVFATMHLAWGSGFWWAVLRLSVRRRTT